MSARNKYGIIENPIKPYQNIVSHSLRYHRYYVVGEYDTKEQAKRNYQSDIDTWRATIKKEIPMWYKLNYPFSFACIGLND